MSEVKSTASQAWNHRLRILHISDLHEQGARAQVAWRRRRVLGDSFLEMLAALTASGQVDLVFFTGDLADWGIADEYTAAQGFVEEVLARVGVPKDRFFCVPGNHDIQRKVEPRAWQKLRKLVPNLDRHDVSRWLKGGGPLPTGIPSGLREKVLLRQSAYRNWVVGQLGRPELDPTKSPHGALGYCVSPSLDRLPFPVHVIGLDTAWLAGDDNDSTRLLLTDDQIGCLTTDAQGKTLGGLKLALMHHPLSDLADRADAFRLLSERVDVLFRGHLHDPTLQELVEPGHTLCEMVAGSLYDSAKEDRFANGCQLLDLTLAADGSIVSAAVEFRSWSPRGHWHPDNSIYKGSQNGRVSWLAASGSATRPLLGKFGDAGAGAVKYCGSVSLVQLIEAWGTPDGSRAPAPATLVVEGPDCGRPLSDALLRLGLHGGIAAIHVDSPMEWDRGARATIDCIGTLVDSWRWTLDPASPGWRVVSRNSAPSAGEFAPIEARMPGDDVAEMLHSTMDAWVWHRLSQATNETLAGDATRLGIPVAEDIRDAMLPVWRQWQAAIGGAPDLLRHFLLATLTTADPPSKRAGLVRVGPRTINPCLLKALLFALAVDVGWDLNTMPMKSQLPENLKFRSGLGHLLGLQLNGGSFLHVNLPSLQLEPQFLLLANVTVQGWG